jgi:hypothetical protein
MSGIWSKIASSYLNARKSNGGLIGQALGKIMPEKDSMVGAAMKRVLKLGRKSKPKEIASSVE